jgi:uncharacterized low-complexity protein
MFLSPKSLSYTMGTVLLGSIALVGNVTASENPFALTQSTNDTIQLACGKNKQAQAEKMDDTDQQTAKCGAGKCGAAMMDTDEGVEEVADTPNNDTANTVDDTKGTVESADTGTSK